MTKPTQCHVIVLSLTQAASNEHADFGPNVPVIPIAACPALFEV